MEVGGEVRTSGDKNGKGWHVGIDRPADGNFVPGADLQATVRLDNSALATSGNYRKFYIDNGVKYSHTIDPRTGYPAQAYASQRHYCCTGMCSGRCMGYCMHGCRKGHGHNLH